MNKIDKKIMIKQAESLKRSISFKLKVMEKTTEEIKLNDKSNYGDVGSMTSILKSLSELDSELLNYKNATLV